MNREEILLTIAALKEEQARVRRSLKDAKEQTAIHSSALAEIQQKFMKWQDQMNTEQGKLYLLDTLLDAYETLRSYYQ